MPMGPFNGKAPAHPDHDRFWATRLGGWMAALGGEGLWPELTRRSDPM